MTDKSGASFVPTAEPKIKPGTKADENEKSDTKPEPASEHTGRTVDLNKIGKPYDGNGGGGCNW